MTTDSALSAMLREYRRQAGRLTAVRSTRLWAWARLVFRKLQHAGESAIVRIEGQTFGAIRVDVDGKHFADCAFHGTTLVFSGGEAPMFSGKIEVARVNFDFAGEAWQTFVWLRRLRAMTSADFIETLLDVPGKSRGGTAH